MGAYQTLAPCIGPAAPQLHIGAGGSAGWAGLQRSQKHYFGLRISTVEIGPTRRSQSPKLLINSRVAGLAMGRSKNLEGSVLCKHVSGNDFGDAGASRLGLGTWLTPKSRLVPTWCVPRRIWSLSAKRYEHFMGSTPDIGPMVSCLYR